MQDRLKYFRIEARELLEQMQSALLELEREGTEPTRTQRLLRLAHTLKGAARVVKQVDIADLAHRLEDLLEPHRERTGPLVRDQAEVLLAVMDEIAAKVGALTQAPSPAPAEAAPTPAPARTASGSDDDESPRELAPVAHVDKLMDGVAEVGFQLGAVRRTLPDISSSQRLAEELMSRLEPRRVTEMTTHGASQLRALVSELTLRLETVEREVTSGVERATRELGQVRDRVDQLRLVAAQSIFGALERTTRDAAVSMGKQARFEAHGGEVRLDAQVLNQVQRALVQAVRNAVAHGIEPAAERAERGKGPQGQVVLDVQLRGKQIRFSCRDDGRGVSLGDVRREAERQGRLAAGADADERALLELLLRGGISTSPRVTQVSGRGVGLDLIREALASVGGEVALETLPGAGTNVILSVPASLSALDALIVECAGAAHAIPLNAVKQAVRLREDEVGRTAEGASLVFEDQLVPFVPLAWLVRPENETEAPRSVWSAVIIQAGGERLALGVDRLLGSESLVSRTLPDSAHVEATVAGVTLDADGNPRLLLDPEGLLARSREQRSRRSPTRPRPRSVLVIDDSLTTRMLEQSILESAGYQVELAVSGEQGLEKARAGRYDLLLVDVEMPGMDGFAFIEQVRADPLLAATPTVLVTSRASAEDLARGKAVGASGHIAKGEFDQVDFLERIKGLMQ
jgi:two-component system, chemotaxis family, sensor kinase CheA